MINTRTFRYDFAVDGGAISTIDMKWTGDERRVPTGGVIPKGSIVIGAIFRVLTAFTSAGSAVVTVEPENVDSPPEFDAAAVATLTAQTKFYLTPSNLAVLTAKLDADGGVTDTNYAALSSNGFAPAILASDSKCQIVIGAAALTAGVLEATWLYIELDKPVK